MKGNQVNVVALQLFFDDSTGEMTFNDENNLECKPMTMMKISNNPYHFKMTISPNK